TAVFPALTAAILHWGTMTEPIYLFFVYVGLWATLRTLSPYWRNLDKVLPDNKAGTPLGVDRRAPWWAYGLAGLSFGLAYLTRPEAIGYVLLSGVFLLALRAWRARRSALRFWEPAFWLKLGVYGLGFALCFLPYAYYVRQHTGAWMVSEKVGVAYLTGIGLAHGDTAAFDRATWGLDSSGLETFFFSSESYRINMLDLILADPRTFAQVLYLNMQRFVQVLIDWTLLPYPFLPLVVLGLFDRGWTRERTIKELYLFLSMAPVLAFTLFFIQARYLVPALPLFILWIGRGLLCLSDWLIGTAIELKTPDGNPSAGSAPGEGASSRPYWHMPSTWRRALTAAPVVAAAIVLLAVHPAVIAQVTNVGSVRIEHRVVGEQLGALVSESDVIMSRYPAIAFHAGCRWVPTPNASWPEVLAYAHHKGVDYWAIDERELRYRPQFGDLITGEQPPSELERILTISSDGERLVVYRLKGGA
ncbi:MAG: hypothetical protein H5T69_19255, partial [Chloroflexi bacterium]|nr:hypothetical protein [Chloroflexota bacterium]